VSENLPGGTAQINELVESILALEFPGKPAMEAMARYLPPNTPNSYLQHVETRRLALQKAPYPQLVALRSQLIAAQQVAQRKAQEAKKAKAADKAAEREAAIQYLKDGTAAILTREALAKRVGRARGRQV
jgi:hypothetical protein